MILRESPYGWGVFSLPMARSLRSPRAAKSAGSGALADFPWRGCLLSLLAAGLVIGGMLLLALFLPSASRRPQPAAMAISVRLPTEPAISPPKPVVPPLPAAAPVKTHRPSPPKPPPRENLPEKMPKEIPQAPPVRMPATTKPPPVPAAEPAEIVLPAPPAPRLAHSAPQMPAALPKQAVILPAPQTATIPPHHQATRPPSPPAAESLPHTARATLALSAPAEHDLTTAIRRGEPIFTAETDSLPTASEQYRGARPAPTDRLPAASAFAPAVDRSAQTILPPPEGEGAAAGISITRKTEIALEMSAPAGREGKMPAATARQPAGKSFAFLDGIPRANLDRSLLVSLNRLKTCRDPGAELNLKTRLAALLSRPGLCRSGGVLFDVLYPESAYSLHVDLYNYEHIDFPDRCAALRQAAECFTARR